MRDEDFEKHRIKWEFFKLHATQRLTLFRFYIGLVTSLFIAYFYLLAHLDDCNGSHFLYICLILSGVGISAISFLFCALDSRNVELIENSKKALQEVEDLSVNNPNTYRHKQIFTAVFRATSVFGIILLTLGSYKYGYCSYAGQLPVALASSPIKDEYECNCAHHHNTESSELKIRQENNSSVTKQPSKNRVFMQGPDSKLHDKKY